MSLFLSCEQTNALLSDYADGLLGPWDRFRMKLHLLFCPDCRAILATLTRENAQQAIRAVTPVI